MIDTWKTWIGQKIRKQSGKPFKSGDKLGTPVEIVTHPFTGRPAFIMKDDGTVVECVKCEVADAVLL